MGLCLHAWDLLRTLLGKCVLLTDDYCSKAFLSLAATFPVKQAAGAAGQAATEAAAARPVGTAVALLLLCSCWEDTSTCTLSIFVHCKHFIDMKS